MTVHLNGGRRSFAEGNDGVIVELISVGDGVKPNKLIFWPGRGEDEVVRASGRI